MTIYIYKYFSKNLNIASILQSAYIQLTSTASVFGLFLCSVNSVCIASDNRSWFYIQAMLSLHAVVDRIGTCSGSFVGSGPADLS